MTSFGYDLAMARQKVTLYLDPVVLRRLRVAAARKGMKDSELVEEAVKEYIGQAALERIWAETAKWGLSDDEALELAVRLQHELRGEQP